MCAPDMSKHKSEDIGLHSLKNRRSFLKKKSLIGSKLKKNDGWTEKLSDEFYPLVGSDSESLSDEELVQQVNYTTIRQRTKNCINKDVANGNPKSSVVELENGGASNSDPFLYYEILHLDVQEGDTLQSLSVKYHCSVADLKRANNIINSQEFYALRKLKIPVKKHSLLTEVLSSEQTIKTNSIVNDNDNSVRTINIGIGPMISGASPNEAADFFKRMDEDLVKIMLNTKSKKDSLEAAAAALTAPQIEPLVKDSYNNMDCHIQWSYLIMTIIIVGIILPLIIVLYMYYMKSPSQHTNVEIVSNNNSVKVFESVVETSIRN